MSQCYTPPLYVIHFKGGLNSGEAQPSSNVLDTELLPCSFLPPSAKETRMGMARIALRSTFFTATASPSETSARHGRLPAKKPTYTISYSTIFAAQLPAT